ncbi:Uu.00g105980.m01.CDS01 [Anthostomella pinea]|uniref:Uu.00g105980.m01.CDS01 n=1 Tax=Anthostomella pinea TaxID=933095 RepID=A0AAI8VER3_9PEZI|nr:Uu.00g105980.m01.CDS01 [Anthostomella pinea]
MATSSSSPSTSAPAATRLGWIGLGSMGAAMAKKIRGHLAAKATSTPLRFFNRTASRGDFLEAAGGKRCASVSEVVEESEVIFISASDDAAIEAIIEQILHGDTTKAVAERLRERGVLFAAMPVFGATPVAEQGRLLVAFAGPLPVYEAVAPFLKGVIAREVLRVGEEPEKATLLKTAGNFMMASLMEIIAEAHVFAEKTGLDANVLEKLLELVFGTVAHSDSVRMTTGVYIPGKGEAPWSDLNLALKDVGHGVDSAQKAGVSLKAAGTALEHLKRAKAYSEANGQRALDSSSLYGIVRQDSGLDFCTDYVRKRDE